MNNFKNEECEIAFLHPFFQQFEKYSANQRNLLIESTLSGKSLLRIIKRDMSALYIKIQVLWFRAFVAENHLFIIGSNFKRKYIKNE
jgi:predicted ABC-type ATPase